SACIYPNPRDRPESRREESGRAPASRGLCGPLRHYHGNQKKAYSKQSVYENQPRDSAQRKALPAPPSPRNSIVPSFTRACTFIPLTSARCKRFASSTERDSRTLQVFRTAGLYQPSYPLAVLSKPRSGDSKRKESSGNFGASINPFSVNSKPISLVAEYSEHAWVCMLSTGKSVQPNGLPPVVSPGCLLNAEFRTSGPLQVPYQTCGYTPACRAKEFFFHSSQAM